MTESTSEYKKRIEEIKQSIESEPYMAKMREDIAEGISKTGIRQATVEEQFQDVQDHYEATVQEKFQNIDDQFQAVIDETTGKDVISAPELIAARNGKSNLKTRLDDEHAQVTAQLQDKGLSVKNFGAKGDGITDDTIAIKEAISFLSLNDDYKRLTFPLGKYVISESVAPYSDDSPITLKNKTIDGEGSTIIDKRFTQGENMFVFSGCENVCFENFYIEGAYSSDTIQDNTIFSNVLLFDKNNNNITVRNINGDGVRGTILQVSPRNGYDCTNFTIDNIQGNTIFQATLLLGSLDSAQMPSKIIGLNVTNITTAYNGCFYDEYGVRTRRSETHWTPGIDYGEALSLLENATFDNCHVRYASESGFHIEGGCACVNVNIQNCSSKYSGSRTNAVYGYGFITVQGVTVNNCITEGNKKPYFYHETTSPYESDDTFFVSLFDRDYGKVIDSGQTLQTFNTENKNTIPLIQQDTDKKSVNTFDVNILKLGKGHDRFYNLAENEERYNFYLPNMNASDLILFDKQSIYRYIAKFKKKSTSRPLTNIFLCEEGPDNRHMVSFNNDTTNNKVDTLQSQALNFRVTKQNISDRLYVYVDQPDEVYYATLEKLEPNTNENLIENPMFLDGEICDFLYNEGDVRSTKFITTPDTTKAYKLIDDSQGRWITTNPELGIANSGNNAVYTNDYPITRNQKVKVLVSHKSDSEINGDTDYINVVLRLYNSSGNLTNSIIKSIKNVTTTTTLSEVVFDVGTIPSTTGCYFSCSFAVISDKTYNNLIPIKFRVLEMLRQY